jgi:membrane fusion protein, multidrug efflux system
MNEKIRHLIQNKPKDLSTFLIFGFGCLIAILLLAGCGKQEATSFERPPAPVTVEPAVTKDVPIYLDAVGKTVAREVVMIQPQISGRITQILFKDGADVKRGTPLFTIDPRPFQAQLDQAEGNLAQAQAALDLAKIEFDRVQNLVNTKAISKQDWDTRKNAVDVAQAQVQQRKAEVENARINLDYCSIRSPIDGRTGQRLVDIGNIVTENDTQLLSIQRLDPIYADFTVTESDLTAVQQNMQKGSLTVEVRLPDGPDVAKNGDLTFLDNSVQDGTGNVRLRATILNSDDYFWPGRFVKIRLVLNTKKDAVIVSAAAPQMSAKGAFVYVVKKDLTAEMRPVTLGQQQGDFVVIQDGVKPGERVVTNGQLGVTPGGKVRVEEVHAESLQTAKSGGKS